MKPAGIWFTKSLTVREAARVLRVHVTRVYRLIQDGELNSVNENGCMHVSSDQIDRYARRRDHWLKLHGRKKAG